MLQLLAVVAVFAIIIVLVGRKWPIAYAMGLGALLLAIATGNGLRGFWLGLLETVQTRSTYELAATVALISLLAKLLKEYDLLPRMTEALAALLRNVRMALLLVPGLLGLLPVFGGAVMSAPMVDSLGDRIGLSPVRKAAVNVTFRHAWFFVFPFSPSLILAANLSKATIGSIIAFTFPLTIITLVAGYIYLFRKLGPEPMRRNARGGTVAESEVAAALDIMAPGVALREFLITASPILVSIILSTVVPPLTGLTIPLHYALVCGVAVAIFLGRRHPKFSAAAVWKAIDWTLVLTMFAIMTFKGVMDQVGFIKDMVAAMVANGIPPVVLFIGLPLVTGFTSGAQQASIAISMPILLPLAGANPAGAVAIIYAASFLGYFLSPIHLCLILTAQFYKAKIAEVYREAIPVVAIVAVSVVALALLTGTGLH